jgi:molecular chaperone DnaJ
MKPSDDPFSLLGLRRTASLEEVKRAYRRLAMRWHPDRNHSAAAENEFKRIKAAYELILDPKRYGEWLKNAGARPHAASEAPEPPASSPPPGDDLTQTLILTLEEAAHGCVKSVELARSNRCTPCHGTGRIKHSHSVACAHCNATGRVRGDQGFRLCEDCAGRGYVRATDCPECAGSGWRKKARTLSVKVPAGIFDGERLRLARQARHGHDADSTAGDLFLEVRLAEHALFQLQQRDLHCTVPVSILRLLGGGKIAVPTLNGSAVLDVQPYPAHGLDYVLPGQGFPKKHGKPGGDLILHLRPVYPLYFGTKDRNLLERLETSLGQDLALRAPDLAAWAELLHGREAGH